MCVFLTRHTYLGIIHAYHIHLFKCAGTENKAKKNKKPKTSFVCDRMFKCNYLKVFITSILHKICFSLIENEHKLLKQTDTLNLIQIIIYHISHNILF